MFWVYIIKSKKDSKFYTGITNDFDRRLMEHNIGETSTSSTLNRGPFILVYKEEFSTRKEARKKEKWFKSGVGRKWRNEKFDNIPG
jgi:putative endonuclease